MSNPKSDNFANECEAITKLIKTIDSDIKTRDEQAKKGGNVTKTNQIIQQQINKLQNKLEALASSLSALEAKPNGISMAEIDRKRKRLNELRNSAAELNDKCNNPGGAGGKPRFVSSQGKKYQDTIDTNNVTVDQLKQDKNKIQESFDQKIDELQDATKQLKAEQGIMRDELKYQNEVLMPKIEGRIDDNLLKAKRNNRKLNKMLKKGSDCCLWFCLLVELAILVMLLLYSD